MKFKFIKANTLDATSLTELSLRSKDYWKYGKQQIEKWREEMTIDSDYIINNQVFKMLNSDELIGFYAYQLGDLKTIKLNYFFLEPKCIGKGFGKLMMTDFLKRMDSTEIKYVFLHADPFAEKFYKNFGFKVVGKLESSIKDRTLPIMKLIINHI